jgi:hypothetical protein
MQREFDRYSRSNRQVAALWGEVQDAREVRRVARSRIAAARSRGDVEQADLLLKDMNDWRRRVWVWLDDTLNVYWVEFRAGGSYSILGAATGQAVWL